MCRVLLFHPQLAQQVTCKHNAAAHTCIALPGALSAAAPCRCIGSSALLGSSALATFSMPFKPRSWQSSNRARTCAASDQTRTLQLLQHPLFTTHTDTASYQHACKWQCKPPAQSPSQQKRTQATAALDPSWFSWLPLASQLTLQQQLEHWLLLDG